MHQHSTNTPEDRQHQWVYITAADVTMGGQTSGKVHGLYQMADTN
jgi:hypothetical protein